MKTKRKGKEKKKKRREEKKKQVLPGIELGTFRTPGRFVVTTPRETHSEIFDNILLLGYLKDSNAADILLILALVRQWDLKASKMTLNVLFTC